MHPKINPGRRNASNLRQWGLKVRRRAHPRTKPRSPILAKGRSIRTNIARIHPSTHIPGPHAASLVVRGTNILVGRGQWRAPHRHHIHHILLRIGLVGPSGPKVRLIHHIRGHIPTREGHLVVEVIVLSLVQSVKPAPVIEAVVPEVEVVGHIRSSVLRVAINHVVDPILRSTIIVTLVLVLPLPSLSPLFPLMSGPENSADDEYND